MMYWGGTSGWWGAGMPVMIVVWIGLIALMFWGVQRLTRSSSSGPGAAEVESARRVLDRRYAAGEINTEQYAEMRRVLEGRSTQVSAH